MFPNPLWILIEIMQVGAKITHTYTHGDIYK